MTYRVRLLDVVAIVAAVATVSAFSLFAYAGDDEPSQVRVQSADGDYLYPLAVDARYTVPGPLGDTVIDVHDGGAQIIDSPCRDKICVAAGHITHSGGWAACLPNRVFLRIEGGSEPDLDGQTF